MVFLSCLRNFVFSSGSVSAASLPRPGWRARNESTEAERFEATDTPRSKRNVGGAVEEDATSSAATAAFGGVGVGSRDRFFCAAGLGSGADCTLELAADLCASVSLRAALTI